MSACAGNIFNQIDSCNQATARYLAIGREQGEREAAAAKAALALIVAAYDAAMQDTRTMIPTPLHLAIEAARRAL